jgi:cathepsin B
MVVFATATKIFEEDYQRPAISQAMIDEINSKQTMWKAAVPVRFANATVADVKRMLGTIMPGEEGYEAPELVKNSWTVEASSLPTNFDARTQWSNCAEVIGRVRDQSNCGSCWAFGSTEALNDRHCISTGKKDIVLSPEDTNSCCSGIHCSGSMGCNGGQPAGAWKWFTSTGVSTGGDWADNGKGTTCKPYSMQSCAHHVTPPEGMVACSDLPSYKTPECTSTCNEKSYDTAYKNDKFFAKSSYSVKKDETAIMQEIYEKGTVSVALSVYEDFESYTSGVYKHVSGKYLGGHAIKMIGWGVEGSTKYWICVNSWNDTWGEKGIFRILRGVDECGIESSVVAGDV